MNINLQIRQLVLDGVSLKPHQRDELKLAVEAELNRLLASNGPGSGLQSASDRSLAPGGVINVDKSANPAHLGQQIGKAVYRSFQK